MPETETLNCETQILKDAVERMGWTQAEAGVYSGLSPRTVARILKGDEKVNVQSIKKLATRVGMATNISFTPLREQPNG